jgi:GNAT superfamily N-acetyltransferase
MEIQIRKAKQKDALALSALIRSLGIFHRLDQETPQDTQQRVHKHLEMCLADESHLLLVAQTKEGQVAGYCSVHWLPYLFLSGPEGYVSELFIREEFRGAGIGGQLLAEIKIAARKRGCARLMLLNFRQRESYQRQFYSKQGWEERVEMANFICTLAD